MIAATSPEERKVLATLEGMGPLAQEIIRKCDTLRAAVQAIERESKLHEKFVKAFDGKTAEEVIAAAEAQQAIGQQDPKVVDQKVEPGAVEGEEKTTIPPGVAQPVTSTFTAPKALRELTRWVCRKDSKGVGGKVTNGKTPCDTTGRTHVPPRAEEGEDLTWKDPDFWMDFDSVVRAYERRPAKLAGIGFIITKDENLAHDQQIIGVDIDACRNPENGHTSPAVLEFLKRLNSPTQVSPSGCGFRVFCIGILPYDVPSKTGYFIANDLNDADKAAILAKKPTVRDKIANGEQGFNAIELYVGGPRHLTVTKGWMSEYPTECENWSEVLRYLLKEYIKENEPAKKSSRTSKPRNSKNLHELLRNKYPISIDQLLDISGFTPEGSQISGPNPWLGSSSGHNLVINPSEGDMGQHAQLHWRNRARRRCLAASGLRLRCRRLGECWPWIDGRS